MAQAAQPAVNRRKAVERENPNDIHAPTTQRRQPLTPRLQAQTTPRQRLGAEVMPA